MVTSKCFNEMDFNYPQLIRRIDHLIDHYREHKKKLKQSIQDEEQAIALLNIFNDKILLEKSIKEHREHLVVLQAKQKEKNAELNNAKENTKLLQNRFTELQQQQQMNHFEIEVDEKYIWMMSGKAFQDFKIAASESSEKRKATIQEATLSGQIKVQEDLKQRLSTVIATMQAEIKNLESLQRQRKQELEVLGNSLRARKHERKNCEKNVEEKAKKELHAKREIADKEADIKQKTKDYNAQLQQLEDALTNANAALATYENELNFITADIRQTKINNKELKPRQTYQVPIPVVKVRRVRHFSGRWSEFWGNPFHYEDELYTDVELKTFTAQEIVNQIKANKNHISNQIKERDAKNQNINNKKSEIDNLNTKIEKHKKDWINTKADLDNGHWKAQDKHKIALVALREAEEAFRLKKIEIIHLEESISSKKHDITLAASVLDTRRQNVEIFNADLTTCEKAISQLESAKRAQETLVSQLPQTEKNNESITTNVEVKLIQAKLEVKHAWDNALKAEAILDQQVIDLNDQILQVEKILFALQQPYEKTVASIREDQELKHKMKIEQATKELILIRDNHHELLQWMLLGQGLVLSSYGDGTDRLHSLISCLLQGIFVSYPPVLLTNLRNLPHPASWTPHIERIQEKLNGINIVLDEKTGEDYFTFLTTLVDVINNEYMNDGTVIEVKIHGRALATKPYVNKTSVPLNLWQYEGQFYLLRAEQELTNLKQDIETAKHRYACYERAYHLITTLREPKLLTSLCEKIIYRDCGHSLALCPPELLVNYCREQLQLDRTSQDGMSHAKKSAFKELATFILNKTEIPADCSTQSDDIYLQAALYSLIKLNELYDDISDEQKEEIDKLVLKDYLAQLKTVVMTEIRRRKESESNVRFDIDASKNDLSLKMQELEKNIHDQEDQISKLEKEITKKEDELESRKKQAADLTKYYGYQQTEIEKNIVELTRLKQEIESQLDVLLTDEPSTLQKYELLSNQRQEICSRLEKLATEKADLKNKLREAHNVQEALEKEQEVQKSKRERLAEVRIINEKYKASEENKIKFLETWTQLLSSVHEKLLHNETAFRNRIAILTECMKILSDEKQHNSIYQCYHYLIEKVDCLRALASDNNNVCIEQSQHAEFVLLTSTWKSDLSNVLKDVLGSPTCSSEAISPLTIQGNNILWSEAWQTLKQKLIQRVQHYGLGFKDDVLVVTNSKLVGKINELPEALKKLLTHHIGLHFQHYTLVCENRVVQTPHWHEIETLLSHEKIIETVKKTKIKLVEVLRAYVDSIEVVAAHHLYLDHDICLPGINLTLVSKEKIHCKENLTIDISGASTSEITVSRAKSGDEYGQGKGQGRDGDDGLDGAAGNAAGHLIMEAGNNIYNWQTLNIVANGANGLKGQLAGHGGTGHKGADMPDAKAEETNGLRKAQFSLVWGRVPGMDKDGQFTRINELSWPGGDAGLAGLGGGGGLAGSVVIHDNELDLRLEEDGNNKIKPDSALTLVSRVKHEFGEPGKNAEREAKGGEPGEAGATGADHLFNKKSFFKTTDSIPGQFLERAYDDPGDYLVPDEACGIDLTMATPITALAFSQQNIQKLDYTENRQRGIHVLGFSSGVPMIKDLSAYRNAPRRHEQSRSSKHGEDNKNRSKPEEKQQKSHHSQTLQHQLMQMTRINQIATSILQNHVVEQCRINYQAEINRYKQRTEQLNKEIQHSLAQEEEASKRENEVTQQLQKINQTVSELKNQIIQIEALENNGNAELTANDLAQLNQIQQLAQQGAEKLQKQAELSCADISVDTAKEVDVQLQQLHVSIQNALKACQDKLMQEINSAQTSRLLQAQRLASLRADYTYIQQIYQNKTVIKTDESRLQKLLDELEQVHQHQEIAKATENFELLVDYIDDDKSETDFNEFEIIHQETRKIFFKMPTLQEQSNKIIELFATMFGRIGNYQDLLKIQQCQDPEAIWIETLDGLRRHLVKQRDPKWMTKHIGNWRNLIKYGEDILSTAPCTLLGLKIIYRNLDALSRHLGTIAKNYQGKCLITLKNITRVVEKRMIDNVVKRATEKSLEGKEKETHVSNLVITMQRAMQVRCMANEPLTLSQQFERKLIFITNISQVVDKFKIEETNAVFADLIDLVLVNTERYDPIVQEKKSVFRQEIREAVGDRFSVEDLDQDIALFERLHLEIEFLHVKVLKEVEWEQNQVTNSSDTIAINNARKKINKLLDKVKKEFLSILKKLQKGKTELTDTLIRQVIKNHQVLAILRTQLEFETKTSPIVRCQLMDKLLTDSSACFKKRDAQAKKVIQEMVQTTLFQFMQTAGLSSPDWLKILETTENIPNLKKENGFLLVSIFERITRGLEVDTTMQAYEACVNILQNVTTETQGITDHIQQLCLRALSKQMDVVRERIQKSAKVNSDSSALAARIYQALSNLNELWFNDYCQLTVPERFAAMRVLKTIGLNQASDTELSALLEDHLKRQLQNVLKQYGNAEDSLATKIKWIITAIEEIATHSKQNNNVAESFDIERKKLTTYVTTLHLVLNKALHLISQSDVYAIEESYHKLARIIIIYEYNNTTDLKGISQQAAVLQRTLNKYYLTIICNDFKKHKDEITNTQKKLLNIINECSVHFNQKMDAIKQKRHYSSQKEFIIYLLHKLIDLHFISVHSDQSSMHAMDYVLQIFSTLKENFININEIDQMETFLIARVNARGKQVLQMQPLFQSNDYDESPIKDCIANLKKKITNADQFGEIITFWQIAFNATMQAITSDQYIETLLKENSWFMRFISESNQLLQYGIPTTEQESSLLEHHHSLRYWLERNYLPAYEKQNAILVQLIRRLNLVAIKENNYVFSPQILELLSKESIAKQVTAARERLEDSILQQLRSTFAMIDVDFGQTIYKHQLISELQKHIFVFTLQDCQLAQAAVSNIFQVNQLRLMQVDENQVIEVDACDPLQFEQFVLQNISGRSLGSKTPTKTFRKLHLNLLQLQGQHFTAIKSFTEKFIAYISDRNILHSDEEKFYLDLMAQSLANLCGIAIRNIKPAEENEVLITRIYKLSAMMGQSDVKLFALYELFTKLSSAPPPVPNSIEDGHENAPSLIHALLDHHPIEALSLFKEFKYSLLFEHHRWKLSCFVISLAFTNTDIFNKERSKKILESLLILKPQSEYVTPSGVNQYVQNTIKEKALDDRFQNGVLNVDVNIRLTLLQIFIGYYTNSIVLSHMAKDNPNRGIILRVSSYVDKLFDEASVLEDSSDLTGFTEGIKQAYQFIQKLETQSWQASFRCSATNLSHSLPPSQSLSSARRQKISLKELLTPIELLLAQTIKNHGFQTPIRNFLQNSHPNQWEMVLREKYIDVISKQCLTDLSEHDAGEFIKLFTDAYTTAQSNQGLSQFYVRTKSIISNDEALKNEEDWQECVQYFLMEIQKNRITIKDFKLILNSVCSLYSFDHIQNSIQEDIHPLVVIKECFYNECVSAIEACIESETQKLALLKKLDNLKLAIFSEDKGYFLLRRLSAALLSYRAKEKSYLYPACLNEILDLIVESKAYAQAHLLSENDSKGLSEKNILLWNHKLKREKYIQLFGLHRDRFSKEVDRLVHLLNSFMKSKTKVAQSLIKLLQQHNAYFESPLSLNSFLTNFANQSWELDQATIDELSTKAPYDWEKHLQDKSNARFKFSAADRTIDQVIDEMCKDVDGINSSIKGLIEKDTNKRSYLEETVRAIDLKFNTDMQNWDETKIQEWVQRFNKQGVQRFNDRSTVVEFIAILMRACKIRINQIPRAVQIAALLLFLNRIQDGTGRLGNISTGEGKSLITMMAAIVIGLRNETADIVTSNEVLAERDAKARESLYKLFGINVSNNCDAECNRNENLRKERYSQNQVIYGTTASFQRDLLLTNFFARSIRGAAGQASSGNWIILDEVDSMFIDNAEKILYISHTIQDLKEINDLFIMIWAAVQSEKNAHSKDLNSRIADVKKEIQKQVTEKRIVYPRLLGDFVDHRLSLWIKNAFIAMSMQKGRQYIIPTTGENRNKVIIMDIDTGVEQTTMHWSNGLHQFIQLSHSLKLTPESLKAVFMSNAVFFKSYNSHIVGMTGTLGAEMETKLMADLYGVDFFKLPRNKSERYKQEPSILKGTEITWIQAIITKLLQKQLPSWQGDNIAQTTREESKAKAKEQIILADQALAKINELRQEKLAKIEANNNHKNSIAKEIEDLKTKLARDVVLDQNYPTGPESRSTLIEKRKVKEEELSKFSEELKNLEAQLHQAIYGEQGEIYYLNLKKNAKAILDNRGARAVLVICKNVRDVEILEEEVRKTAGLNKTVLHILKSKDDSLPKEKLGPHDIIIATNIASRGTDLETLLTLEENGGLHVVLGYIPGNIRVEEQAFKRTSRNGNTGSGQFIVWDGRALSHPELNITVDKLREMRDVEEAQRLDRIRSHGIPKLLREQALFVQFIKLQHQIKQKLETKVKEPKQLDQKFIEVQLKSLQNRWAFFLDCIDSKITDIENVDQATLDQEFARFSAEVLRFIEIPPFYLIVEASEFMRMARYCMDPKLMSEVGNSVAYRMAIDYLNAIIEREPNFAAFAYYYKAHCNFALKQNSLESKQSMRRSLQQAIDLMEEKIGRLSTASQFLQVLRRRQQSLGKGLNDDEFSRSNANTISLLQIHINAARDALGIELSADSFRSATVTGEETKTVFTNTRKHLAEFLKSYRLSQKANVKTLDKNSQALGLYYKDKLIELPPMSPVVCDFILKKLIPANRELVSREKISPEFFADLFITQKQFLTKLGSHRYSQESAYRLHKDATITIKGPLEHPAFFGSSNEIIRSFKEAILKISGAVTENDLRVIIADANISAEQNKAVIQYLCEKSILTESSIFLLTSEMLVSIKTYIETITLSDKAINSDELELSSYPELRGCMESITKVLQPGNSFTAEKLFQTSILKERDVRAFRVLYQIMKTKGYFKSTLLEILSLQNTFASEHHYDVESALINLYEANQNKKAGELLLPQDSAEKVNQLWGYLKSMKIVKDPTVKLRLQKNPDEVLDKIKQRIENQLNHIVEKNIEDNKERKKYVDSIYAAIERCVGKIKQFNDLKINEKYLYDYFKEGKVPPELAEFNQECYDIVLTLAEDVGFPWGAIVVGMLAMMQIAAGVIVGALSFGTAAYISSVLISEGISDMIFAIQCGISGTFSWSTYGDHKWQSLLISIATAGVAYGLTAASGATANIASHSVNTFTQKFLGHLLQAGIACAISMVSDQLTKLVLANIVNDIEANFEKWVRDCATYKEAEKRLLGLLGELYDYFGPTEAKMMVGEMIADNVRERNQSFTNIFSGKLIATMQKLSSSLSITVRQLAGENATAKTAASLIQVADAVAIGADITNKLRDIASMTPELLEQFVKSLERAKHKTKPSADNVNLAKLTQTREKFCEEMLQQQTKAVIDEIKQFVKSSILQSGTQALLQLAVKPLNKLINDELIEKLQETEEKITISMNPDEDTNTLMSAADEMSNNDDEILSSDEEGEEQNEKINHSKNRQQTFAKRTGVFGNRSAFFGSADASHASTDLNLPRYDFDSDPAVAGYIAVDPSLGPDIKGFHGEKAMIQTMESVGYKHINIKLPRNNGLDGIFVKLSADGKTITDVIVVEAKYAKSGVGRLNMTESMGQQFSKKWIDANIDKLLHSNNPQHIAVGKVLDAARDNGMLRAKTVVLSPSGRLRWSENSIRGLQPSIYTQRKAPTGMKMPAGAHPIDKLAAATSSTPSATATPAKGIAFTKGLNILGTGLAIYGLFESGKAVYNQYQADKVTQDFTQTYRTAAAEVGCMATKAALVKGGTMVGTLVTPGVGSIVGGAVGGGIGAAVCFYGKRSWLEQQPSTPVQTTILP